MHHVVHYVMHYVMHCVMHYVMHCGEDLSTASLAVAAAVLALIAACMMAGCCGACGGKRRERDVEGTQPILQGFAHRSDDQDDDEVCMQCMYVRMHVRICISTNMHAYLRVALPYSQLPHLLRSRGRRTRVASSRPRRHARASPRKRSGSQPPQRPPPPPPPPVRLHHPAPHPAARMPTKN